MKELGRGHFPKIEFNIIESPRDPINSKHLTVKSSSNVISTGFQRNMNDRCEIVRVRV